MCIVLPLLELLQGCEWLGMVDVEVGQGKGDGPEEQSMFEE